MEARTARLTTCPTCGSDVHICSGTTSHFIPLKNAYNTWKHTYGKNLDPEVYEDVVKEFEYAIHRLSHLMEAKQVIDSLKEILNKARIV